MEPLTADDPMKSFRDALERIEANMVAAFRSYDKAPEPVPYAVCRMPRPTRTASSRKS